MRRCTECGSPVDRNARFCTSCGTSLESAPERSDDEAGCLNCGDPLPPDASYCRVCGADQHPPEDSSLRRCWNCDADLVHAARTCTHCGETQPPYHRQRGTYERFCPECGSIVRARTNYCRRCGTAQPGTDGDR